MSASSVCRARTGADWAAAGELLDEHRRWLIEVVGDVTATQPSAGAEFGDPGRYYRPPDADMVVARVGGHPAGVVGVHRLTAGTAELKRMFLRPWARGHGLGRALLDEAVAAAIDLGFADVRLQTHPGVMPVAHRLYRDYGFVPAAAYHDLGIEGVETLVLDLTTLPGVEAAAS